MLDPVQKAVLAQRRALAVAKATLALASPAERLELAERLRNSLRLVDRLIVKVDPSGALRKAAKRTAVPAFMRKQ